MDKFIINAYVIALMLVLCCRIITTVKAENSVVSFAMYKRALNLRVPAKTKSMFLFGPRQTGKNTLLKNQFPKALFIDLLEADTFRELSARPEILRERVEAQTNKLIVIDEIQKIPELLNEVHGLIEKALIFSGGERFLLACTRLFLGNWNSRTSSKQCFGALYQEL